jgi:RNA polymerase sigma-70 factor, ECF subfamily
LRLIACAERDFFVVMQPLESTDSELVYRFRSGDESAFDALLERYRSPVFNFVYRLLGNTADAEDVAQETFVRVYQKMDSYRPEEKFSTWLFAIARHRALDRLRYRQRHPTTPLDAAPEPSSTSNAAADRELGEQIAAAIQKLPEDQRTAIILSEYHDLSHSEIATIMGCSEKSVESRLYRARKTLRELLRGFL